MVVALYAPDLAAWPKAAVGPFIALDPHSAPDSSCCFSGDEEYAMSADVRLLLVRLDAFLRGVARTPRKHGQEAVIHARRRLGRRSGRASRCSRGEQPLARARHRTQMRWCCCRAGAPAVFLSV